MTIGDDIAAALPELRRQAESLMTLTLTAYAPSKSAVGDWDETTYAEQGSTPGKVQGTSAVGKDSVSRTVTVNQVPRPVVEGGLQIPLASYVAGNVLPIVASEQRGVAWEFEVTDVGDADPSLLGRRYMVVNCPAKSYATARRMDVVEVPVPKEA